MRKTWHGLAALVFLFAVVVSLDLAAGGLDPVGFAYYGVGFDSRMPVLFTLLAILQGFSLAEAGILAWRRRGWKWWTSLAVAALTLPFLLVLTIARLDLWRFAARSRAADLLAGLLMMALLAAAFLLRRRAWRLSDREYARKQRVRKILDFEGRLPWEGDLDELRRRNEED